MIRAITVGCLWIALIPTALLAADDGDLFFETNVRPVLIAECQKCHGAGKSESGLRVDSRKWLLEGGDRGPAIVPGHPEQSLMIQAIRRVDPDLAMPPGRALKEADKTALTEWIKTGARWPAELISDAPRTHTAPKPHWAFQVVQEAVAPVDPTGWSQTAIDRFISARHRSSGVHHVAEADRRTMIRRLSFDLLGLPPTPEEIEHFLADDTPGAWLRLIDRTLASPHYGERWGRHWMDVAHYADTAGDNADYPVPEAALYRDYIIGAFNSDKPYDQFVREQIAGDLLANRPNGHIDPDAIVATGFLALARRYATAPFELWHLTLEDAIETTGRAFLGLTLRCARCHDHKFDPVTQRDYYSLYGMFASTKFAYAGSEEFVTKKFPRMNFLPLVDPRTAQSELESYKKRLTAVEQSIESWKSPKTDADHRRLKELASEQSRLVRTGLPPGLPTAYAVSEGPAADAPVHRRGEPSAPGPAVPRGVPRFPFLAGDPPPKTIQGSGRLEFAQWLTRPNNPLTARVMVNRIWQHHFGRGLVATPSNFGIRGEPPTHPEILDYLANRLIESGWSVKAVHREILLSQTYRLASQNDLANAAIDPENRLIWKHSRRRLDAESIRDAMLAVGGNLETRMAGRHPFPPIEAWGWSQHNAFKAVYPSDRRSVYLMTQRLVRHPFLALFDGPDTNASTDVRTTATVPLQALYLMNNPFVTDQAQAFATRLLSHCGSDDARVAFAYQLSCGRLPDRGELARGVRYLSDYESAARSARERSGDPRQQAFTSFAKVLLTANEFLYID